MAWGKLASAVGIYLGSRIIGRKIEDITGLGGDDGGGGGGGAAMPPNPHIQSPVQYTMGQKTAYVAGRGFRRH